MLKKLALAISFCAALAAPAAAFDSAFRADVMRQLRALAGTLGNYGAYEVGSVDQVVASGGSVVDRVRLLARKEYAIVAVCDRDCDGMAIELFDENGNLIDSASGSDKLAVTVRPRWTGIFRVRLTMTDCSTSSCHAGFAVFRE